MKMLYKFTIIIIKLLLWLLDSDHRNKEEISMDDVKKFTHIIDQDFKSDFGHVSKAFRTVPYEVWELKTETKSLYAADKHRIIKDDNSCVWIEDLKIGDVIKTNNGLEKVTKVRSLNIRTHMYCVQVEADDEYNHLYYTDGILSHNTETTVGYMLWKSLFTPNYTILITANNYLQALEIMSRVRYSYENLPNHIRAGTTAYNKGSVEFDNGSRIVSRATTPNAGRGLSISLLYVDEFAALLPRVAKDFWAAIKPTLSTGGSCIITSTPQTDVDQFAQLWKGSIEGTIDEYGNPVSDVGINGFHGILVPWHFHPDRDEAWAEGERSSMGESKFRQEHNAEFVSDQETLIHNLTLDRMNKKVTKPEFYTGTVRWYREIEPRKAYLVALDPSLGTENDYAAIQVFQIPEMIQVAEWQSNNMAPRHQVRILREILLELEGAILDNPNQNNDPEIFWTFENNTIGESILTIIEDTGEERFPGQLITERRRKGISTKRVRRGLNTVNKNKLSACSRLKSLLESDRMTIYSNNLLTELKNFIPVGNTFKAKQGEHDDLVSSLLMIVRMLDVVLAWENVESGNLREYINDDGDDDYNDDDEPLPIMFSG